MRPDVLILGDLEGDLQPQITGLFCKQIIKVFHTVQNLLDCLQEYFKLF
jgi:hypothetical protein